jgi:magnesium transporter
VTVRTLDHIDHAEIGGLLDRDEFFWLDAVRPSDAQIDELAERLNWHRLAVEDVKEFHQRPKLDTYRTHALMVFYGIHERELVEVHVFVSGGWIVTVRHAPCLHLEDKRAALGAEPPGTEEDVVYCVLDALTDSFFPLIREADDEIERLEEAIVAAPHEEQLSHALGLRRRVGPARRVADDQRDMFADVHSVLDRLPGLETSDEAAASFGDIADHLHKIADHLDGLRDRLAGALQLYSSMSDNRLNLVTEKLTLVATVFLPLTFTVGFFGQNFGWMVRHVNSFGGFVFWGLVVGELVPLVLIYALFRRAGWLRRPVVSPTLHKRTDED